MTVHAYETRRDQFAAMQEELEILRETVRQLQEIIAPVIVTPATWRLSKFEERMLVAIRAAGGSLLHRERALIALYGIECDACDPKSLDIFLVRTRQKLRKAGSKIRIETVWGRGWRMPPESIALFDAAVAADNPGVSFAGAASLRRAA